jgi:pimeloyl-ACP methyl ester carboxylesterase
MSLGSALALATERIVAPVEGMHRAISGRWFTVFDPIARPARWVHHAISDVVYGSIRLGGTAVGMGVDARGNATAPTTDSVQAVVNGLWGDALGRYERRLEIPMGIRDRRGGPVEVGSELAAEFPAPTGRLVLLVHGLMETERCWLGRDGEPGLREALEISPEVTPLDIRYNTGRRVSDNGSRLASLLEDVHSSWPVPVESVVLVGHSMGGLVIRSACATARAAGQRWIDDVSDVVTLGTPHRGAPLEKGTNIVAWGLGLVAETRPLADALNVRSAGIKDLRFGAIAEDDWGGFDPDALLRNSVGDHPLPPDIDHHFVTGVMTSDPNHPVGVVMGDLVVRPASGTGGRHLDPTNVVVLGGLRHYEVLGDPAVINRVMGWVAPASHG